LPGETQGAYAQQMPQHACFNGKEVMLKLFKSQDPAKKLQKEYEKLQKQAYELSHTDRKASDALTAKAEEVWKKIEALKESK
jgi:Skp family chaperone for outer membrane proteins